MQHPLYYIIFLICYMASDFISIWGMFFTLKYPNMGMIEAFFLKLGLTDIRFKPTYNPYTEPSMEIFHWHEVAGGVQSWRWRQGDASGSGSRS